MFKGERNWIFWLGLIVVASASTVLFSILWNLIFIYPLLTDPRFIVQMAVGTGMQPNYALSLFRAYSWLSYIGGSYFQSDYYLKLLVPPTAGASTFIMIGLYMMKAGREAEEEKTQSSPSSSCLL